MGRREDTLHDGVTGRVWYLRRDGTERPASGIRVSTGRRSATLMSGRDRLPVAPDDFFVKVTTPRGFRAAGPWYHSLDPRAGGPARVLPGPR